MKTRIIGFVLFLFAQYTILGQAAASSNYATQTGTLGTTYSWIDCSGGTDIVSGDDAEGSIAWPFDFYFYDNIYTTSNSLSVSTNGFIRLDGTASTNFTAAQNYTLSSGSTELGQIIGLAVYDGKVGDNGGWVRYLETGTAPNRVLTIEYNNLEINWNANRYADVQVSFYESNKKVVLKFGSDNVNIAGADMGIQSGVNGFFNKWQEVDSGTNNAWIEYTPTSTPPPPSGPAASWNYNVLEGTTGATYSWIDCTSGSTIAAGDDTQTSINWPFNFSFYDNNYTTSDNLSVASNGFIRLDDVADGSNYQGANSYNLTTNATGFGQIIALAMYDGKIGDNGGWIRYLVTGTAPERIFTIEYNNLEIDYNDNRYADVQVSFYESSNKIVLKLGTENLKNAVSGVDMGLHSGVNGYFNKWKEVTNGGNNTWIEYTPPYIEVNATIGTSIAYYPTLKEAFDKINDGTHRGVITTKIKENTVETSSAILNASGTGISNYASVNIYPTKTGLSVSGNLATPLIDLNGADNVTIDGRVNATGSAIGLTINNTSTATTGGTSTIRFINGATNNIVKYCSIKGAETNTSSGVLFFSTSITSTGNNSNTISNNSITNSTDANRPLNGVFSSGTSGLENKLNTISNNNIFNFFNRNIASNGILLVGNTSQFTITGNSFYETSAFIPTNTVAYNVIQINTTTGNNFTVSNNFIGGKSALSGGSAWTKTNARSNIFNAINIAVGTTTASSVQNNTIKNFNWSNSANGDWTAINAAGGDLNIGTVTGNTIGASTGNDAILVTGATTGLNVYGIYISSTGIINCQNNSIGSITAANAGTFASNIYGIFKSATHGIITISNNAIGSASTTNSINASSTSTNNEQVVYGVYNAGFGTITIANNVISKLNNGTTNSTVGTLGLIQGITCIDGTVTIDTNTIYDLTIANANTNALNAAAVCGISATGVSLTKTITENTIYNLSNTASTFAGSVIGLYYSGATIGVSSVSKNLIHSLSVTGASSTAASIYGIKIASGTTTYSNNILILGGDSRSTMYGIYETGAAGNNNTIYFNTIYLGGNLISGATNKSYALFSNAATNTRNFRNNIFMNARSTIGGSNLHYAAYFNTTGGTFTVDYNDYFASGTGGVLGFYGANKTSLPIVTGADATSLAIDPVFKVAGSTQFTDYYSASGLPGVTIAGFTSDYESISRADPPKMGALESSLAFIWQGNTSTDFATASNWLNGGVPSNGVDISFAPTPANDCILDSNRTLKIITNTSSKKLILNGYELTITGSIAAPTVNQIDATSVSSGIIFYGETAQIVSSSVFVSSSINALTNNNSFGLTQVGNITIESSLNLTDGTFTIGANTLTINGGITATLGSFIGGSTSNILVGGSGTSTNLPAVELNNLTLNRTNGISLSGNVNVNGLLTLTNGTLDVEANYLTIFGNTIARTNGDINNTNTAGGVIFSNSAALILPLSIFTSGTIENLTINGAGGLTANENFTVNGILNLQNVNPSPFKGLLDITDPNELIMGANATNIGGGDVTGIITRNTILDNRTYTFGNKNTSLSFYSGSTSLPTYMKLKVAIGNDLWGTGTIKRVYELIQANGNNFLATFRAFYLDSELNGNAEEDLSFWAASSPFNAPVDNARSNSNATENWVEISDFDLAYLPSTFGTFQISLDESNLSYKIWTGRENNIWDNPANWADLPFPGSIPTPDSFVVIPDAATTPNDPTLPPNATTVIKTISLKAGSILNSGATDNAQLSLNHNIGTWNNAGGVFNPGNSTVNFIFGGNTTISGATNFNNLYIADSTFVNVTSNSYIKISDGITISEVGLNSGEFRTRGTGETTVEYNGINQTIINPINSGGNNGYSNLVLSGSGTKTMPITNMTIGKSFRVKGTASATAQAALTILEAMHIEATGTFISGIFNHNVGGHIDVDGSFTASVGSTFTLNGAASQSILGGSPITFDTLVSNNSISVNIDTGITVNNELTLTSGILNVENTTLTLNGNLTKTAGYLGLSELSSLYFGGTTALTLPTTLFVSDPSFKNLTINRTGGVIAGSNMGVNGILNLQSANPTANIGSFDTASFVLDMEHLSTTIGVGDVTGKVRRTTILPDIDYTFGNQFTGVRFPNIGTLPSEIILKISIGSSPSWRPTGVQRILDISQIGGDGTSGVIKAHYLDSELNGLNEADLSLFSWVFPSSTLLDRGRTEINVIDNWITLSNTNFGNLPSSLGVIEHGIGISVSNIITWDGSVSTDWYDPNNWTPVFAPSSIKKAIIPDATTTPNDPIITAGTSSFLNTLDIQTGAILNAGNNSELTVVGSGGAWTNTGTFNAGTGKVIFNNGDLLQIVTIAGVTDFYNIEAAANTAVQPVANSILRIAGVGVADITSLVDFSTVNNTVEWNGANQTIVNPIGFGGGSGYYNLILSGSGTKTMPTSEMNIKGDFSTAGTISATINEVLNVDGNFTIGAGTTLNPGISNHSVGMNFVNNGTLSSGTGCNMNFNGTTVQTISGSSPIHFDILTIDNLLGVTTLNNIEINNQLVLNGGNLVVGSATVGINGAISNPSGAIEVNTASNLNFGGTTALTLNDNLFSTTPSLNNITINNSAGITLGNQDLTINGTLDLPLGIFTVSDKTLTLAGNSPTRTLGAIDASNSNATIAFANATSMVLPGALFTGNITNFTVNGTGGVASNGDLSITGILNLASTNPNATTGGLNMVSPSILDMGVDATTIGIGDVTGIVKREHTFSDGIEYTFGNEFTSLNFLNVPGGIKPTWIKCKITIGSAPSWRNQAVKRTYSFAQSGGTDRMITKLHYLDSELDVTETDEFELVYWDAYDPAFGVNNFVEFYPRNKNGNNVNDNWVQLNGPAINYIATSNLLDVKQWGLSYGDMITHLHIWTGNGSPTYDGDWSLPGNWEGGVPQKEDAVLIPHPSTLPADNNGDLNPYTNLLPIIAPSEVKSLEIVAGATLSATDYDITVYGFTDAWVNNGTFDPGTATVNFYHGDETEAVSIAGTTNFYNLKVDNKTLIQPATGSVIRIENKLIPVDLTSVLDFTTNNNTIDYNGTAQTVIEATGGTTGYYNLKLSGNGIKILPATSFQIIGDLTVAESAITTTESDLTIGANLNLTGTSLFNVGAAKTLSVNGAIVNSVGTAGFVLKSTTDGTASLIHNTNNVPATVERYISGAAEAWHFLSSPVSNQTIASSSWTPLGSYGNGTGYDLYVWDEPTPCWVYHKNDVGALPYDPNNPDWPTVHPLPDFVSGRGYLYSVQALNPTNEFVGNLNNGNISYPLTAISTADPLLTGFNLIGNPYPSSIDWKASTGWTRANLVLTGGGYDMWIWNPAANNYGTYNSFTSIGTNSVTQYIAPMQGFFVKAGSNANIEMANGIRVHTGASNWMRPSSSNSRISNVKVQIASNSGLGFDEVLLQFGHSSNELGAAKLFSTTKTAPSAYLKQGKEELSVMYLTDTIDNPFVPIMFKPGSDGNYSFNIDFDYGFFDYVFLEDKKAKTFYNLLENPVYKFKGKLSDDLDRFVLHFTPKSEVENELSSKIYYDGNDIVVDLTLVPEQTEVNIYDMLGRLILSKTVTGNTIHRFSISKTNQILIVSAKSENKTKRSKVLIY